MQRLSYLIFHAVLGCTAFFACLFQNQYDLPPFPEVFDHADVATVPLAVNSMPASAEAYKTRPIELITVTFRSGAGGLSLPQAPKDWIQLSDATEAFSLVYDPAPCSSPSREFSSFWKVGMSTVGFEARRLIAGYRGAYPGTQHPEPFEDIEKLKDSFLKKLEEDDSVSAITRQGIVADIEQRLAKAKSEHDRRLVISIASELDPRLTTHSNDELIVKWDQENLNVGDQILASAQLITEIQYRNIHHLMLKIPPNSNMSFSSIQELINSIRQNVGHVKFVEVRLD